MDKKYCVFCGSDSIDKIIGKNEYDCIDCDETFDQDAMDDQKATMEAVAMEVQQGKDLSTPLHEIGKLAVKHAKDDDIVTRLYRGFPYLIDALGVIDGKLIKELVK